MGAYEIPRRTYLDLLRKAVATLGHLPDGKPPGHAAPAQDGANILPWVADSLDLL
jgi:hypothetical protein